MGRKFSLTLLRAIFQRIHRVNFGRLEIETTIDDAGTFVKTWTARTVSDLAPGEEIQEFICNENNKYLKH